MPTDVNQILTSQERERLGGRASMPAFQSCLQRLRGESALFVTKETAVPELPGGYCHDYICPEHGEFLQFERGEHRCQVDGRRFRGPVYDAAQRWYVNQELSEGALHLAVLHSIEPTPSTFNAVRRILLKYAEKYQSYASQAHDEDNPGIATYTTLDESVWVIPLAWAYSLVAGHLTPGDSAAVASGLFIPAAEHLIARRYEEIHNFTCWHNAAIATIGRVAQREDFIQIAASGRLGQFAQIEQGLHRDGLWYEGSMSYHFFTLWALFLSGIALRHNPQTNILQLSAMRQALLAPIASTFPDGSLPAMNDCWRFTSLLGEVCHGVPRAAAFYELGLTLYGDPQFAAVLNRNYVAASRDFYALLFGVDDIPQEPWPSCVSHLFPSSGLGTLRPSADLLLTLKFGPHGGYHGHPDKLSLSGVAGRWHFSSDLGTPAYGLESLETWYRQTLSHNTVLIDGQSQPAAQGTLRQYSVDHYPQIADAEIVWDEGAYQGVFMRRAILAQPEYFIDLFLVNRPSPGTIDWVYHVSGSMVPRPNTAMVALAGGEPYHHLKNTSSDSGIGPKCFEWRDGDNALRLGLYADDLEILVTGSSPGNPPTELREFLLRRRTVAKTAFVAVIQVNRDPLQVAWHDACSFDVSVSGRVDRWNITVSGNHADYGFSCEAVAPEAHW